MHRDFVEFVERLTKNKVDFMIIGGMALAFYGFPRYTGDLDLWIIPTLENAKKVFKTIEEFFETSLSADPEDFIKGKNMITLGEEPVQIQIHTFLDGVTEEEIWNTKKKSTLGSIDVFYIGKDTFIKNKKAVGGIRIL